jgi:Short C-terminal domain
MASDPAASRAQGMLKGDGDARTGADTAVSPTVHASRGRMIVVNVLIGVTTLLLVVGVFSVWANRLLFNPDNWSNTSTQLLQNPTIRATTANYLVDQLYANVNVPGLIKSGLPTRLQPLAAPAAGALRNAAVQGVEQALTRPRVQNLWAQANRAADQTFIAVVNGGKGAVQVNKGVITLNLGLILDNVASRLGLPSNLSAKLPPQIANLTVFKSDQLKFVQDVGKAIKGLALWLTILVPLLYALAIGLAPAGRRRRTLMNIGAAAVLGGVLVILGRSLLQSQIASALTNDASLRPTISATILIATSMLAEIAGACILVGLVLFFAGWFAGPARLARSVRQAIAPFLRDHPAETYAITLAILVLIFIWDPIPATGTPAGIIVFTLLALLGTYILRRQTIDEFPDAEHGATMAKLRAQVQARQQQRQRVRSTPAAAGTGTMPEQLRQLVELRDHGEITGEEYQAAKDELLHSPR